MSAGHPLIPQEENSLVSLPDELLLEILGSLSWRDVMRVRLTCTCLRKISKMAWPSVARHESRDIWWLEKPVSAHTEDELEYLYSRRQSAEIGYAMMANGTGPIVSTPMLGAGCCCVTPGGRWLLMSNNMGSLLYLDLDAPEITPNVLIPEQPIQCVSLISLDLDTSCPSLRFNLAFSLQDIVTPYAQTHISVWQVNTVIDDTGSVALRASCLTAFLPEPQGYVQSLSLLGDSLAYSHTRCEHALTAVVEWKLIEGPNYPKRIFYPSAGYSSPSW
ncbi:hypothetical protein BDN72DRAFT_488726 [Pluteus cervinus]|uniref:Uncharacterized protein n=1 Tax=Pluteus cervinus TaxID=181527 RepID=A0ACD3A6Q5_9AGAR|nr:hypothetical protein BDN72DRAFT_488726 [Pluteus cervinus]